MSNSFSENESKTEVCLFYARDHLLINLNVNGTVVKSKKSIKILGVEFDSKLQWDKQVAQAARKAKKALLDIRLIRTYFNSEELKMLITSN